MQTESSTSSSSYTSSANAALPLFARGVFSLLACWPALRIAVTHNWIPKKQASSSAENDGVSVKTAADKRIRLAEEIVDAYYSTYVEKQGKIVEDEEMEDFLVEFVEVEFGIALEDASEMQVAKDCRTVFKDALSGTTENVERFERMAKKAREEDNDPARAMRGTRTGAQDGEDSGDDSSENDGGDDGMDVDMPAAAPPREREEPVVDEDGFTMVTKKGGKR